MTCLRVPLILIGLGWAIAVHGTGPVDYRVEVPADLDSLSVRVCPGNPSASEFRSRLPKAGEYVTLPGSESGNGVASLRGDRIHFRGEPGQCFDYHVDLAAALAEDDSRLIFARDDARLMSSALWLWRPDTPSGGGEVRLRFDLPEGYRVSVPWHPAPGAGKDTYLLGDTPASWPDRIAIGRIPVTGVTVPGARLRVAFLGGKVFPGDPGLKEWIAEAARAVTTLYGRFPLHSPQVLIVPLGPSDEPVPWAQILRGGGASVHFFVDETRPLEEFRRDWTATHELSHLLLPYVRRTDAWLSEGFASYYQNVLRARAGMLSPEQAWQKLYEGFDRGRKGTRGAPLREASEEMVPRRAFMRVYWSGAAIALLADLELRRRTDGTRSLDTALAALADCCLPSQHAWSGREVFSRLDELTGQTVFMELYEHHAGSPRFPDLEPASTWLGIEYADGRIRLSQGRRAARLREAIMTPPQDRPQATRLPSERQDDQ